MNVFIFPNSFPLTYCGKCSARLRGKSEATESGVALSGTRSAAAGLTFELNDDHMQRLIANVLRSMSQRVAIENVAGFQCALRGLPVRCVVAIPASR